MRGNLKKPRYGISGFLLGSLGVYHERIAIAGDEDRLVLVKERLLRSKKRNGKFSDSEFHLQETRLKEANLLIRNSMDCFIALSTKVAESDRFHLIRSFRVSGINHGNILRVLFSDGYSCGLVVRDHVQRLCETQACRLC